MPQQDIDAVLPPMNLLIASYGLNSTAIVNALDKTLNAISFRFRSSHWLMPFFSPCRRQIMNAAEFDSTMLSTPQIISAELPVIKPTVNETPTFSRLYIRLPAST